MIQYDIDHEIEYEVEEETALEDNPHGLLPTTVEFN